MERIRSSSVSSPKISDASRSRHRSGGTRRRRESNPLLRFCRPPPGRLAPALVARPSPRRAMSSPGIEPGPRPSQSRVRIRHTPRTSIETGPLPSPPPGSRTRPCGFEDRRASATPAGKQSECPRQESNLVFDLRRVACDPSHSKGAIRSRRPDSNRHEPAYKAGASPFGHVGEISRGARIRTLSASFGGSLLSQEHTPVESDPGPCPMPGRCSRSGQEQGRLVRQEPGPALDADALRPRRTASTRAGPAGAAAACRPARGCGRPCGRCTRRRRRRSWSSSTRRPASAAGRGRS